MPGEIMTEVSATAPGGAGDVLAAFAELTRRPLPDGLVRTELLAGRDGDWKIQSLCRDQAAPDAMRAGPERAVSLLGGRGTGQRRGGQAAVHLAAHRQHSPAARVRHAGPTEPGRRHNRSVAGQFNRFRCAKDQGSCSWWRRRAGG